jgi:peroxiredoxin
MASSGTWTILLTAALSLIPTTEPAPGKPVDFKLQDFRGGWHQLEDARDSKVVVLAFLGTECPLAGLYAPKLAELARGYEKKGAAFFGVNSGPQDAPSALAQFAREQDLPFPLLKDVNYELAGRLGVERTPEVFVLDSDRVVRYRGRVDDQFGFGVHRPAPTKRDLAAALDDLLAGRPVKNTSDPGRWLPDRARVRGQRRCDDKLLEAGRADPSQSLCGLPSRGRNRPVFPDLVQAGCRLGKHDRRGRPGGADAAVARQPGVWKVLE